VNNIFVIFFVYNIYEKLLYEKMHEVKNYKIEFFDEASRFMNLVILFLICFYIKNNLIFCHSSESFTKHIEKIII
jgi:hypothetical protein